MLRKSRPRIQAHRGGFVPAFRGTVPAAAGTLQPPTRNAKAPPPRSLGGLILHDFGLVVEN